MSLINDIILWLWRLLPGNPILVRVVQGASKRVRHLWARVLYLVMLFVVLIASNPGAVSTGNSSLAELAKQSTSTFLYVSLIQLLLMTFIAPIFTAGAITQEKDANTFHILLTTPLSTGQIVLGSLFSRLYFVWALLIAGLPIFCITMIFGGVTTAEIFQSFGLAATTGLVTGALAIMIGVIRVGTRKTIFSFFVGIAIYIVGLGAIGLSAFGKLPEAPIGPLGYQMSFLAPIHPILALLVVTGQTPAPAMEEVAGYGWPLANIYAAPQFAYMWLTALSSVVMILLSLGFVRAGQKEGEPTLWSRIFGSGTRRAESDDRRKPPRRVWSNPIAWREAKTRGAGGSRLAVRIVFIAIGIGIGLMLLVAHQQGALGMSPTQPQFTRSWLTALIWIELAVILLVVTSTAATTLTREKESMTMELLLTTPLTSRYIIGGMLRGLVSSVLPLIAIPTATVLMFAVADLTRPAGQSVTVLEAALLTPLLMIMFAAPAAMIGLLFSLNSKKTVQAVMGSTAVVLGAAGIMWGCGFAILQGGGFLSAVVLPFTPFPAMQAVIDCPSLFASASDSYGNPTPPGLDELSAARATRAVTSLIAAGVYGAITYALYNNMVKNYDMTVRRQSA